MCWTSSCNSQILPQVLLKLMPKREWLDHLKMDANPNNQLICVLRLFCEEFGMGAHLQTGMSMQTCWVQLWSGPVILDRHSSHHMKSRNGQKKDVKQACDELAEPPSKPKQKTKILKFFYWTDTSFSCLPHSLHQRWNVVTRTLTQVRHFTGRARQLHLWSTFHTQGNSLCFTWL